MVYSAPLAALLLFAPPPKVSFSFVAAGGIEARGVPILDPFAVDVPSPSPNVARPGFSA